MIVVDQDDVKKSKLSGWLNQMKQFKWVAVVLVMIDMHESSKIFSKQAQSDDDYCIEYPSNRAQLKQRISDFCDGQYGSAVKGALPSLIEGKYDGVKLSSAPAGNNKAAVVSRIQAYVDKYATTMRGNFDSRIKSPEAPVKLKQALDFRKIILDGDIAISADLLQQQEEACRWLAENKLDGADGDELWRQTKVVTGWVKSNYSPFYDSKLKGLQLYGERGIFHMLHKKRGDICNGALESFFIMVDYMVSYKVSQSDTERIGSDMNLTKTDLRKNLGDLTYRALVFVAFNMPPAHLLDLQPFLDAWAHLNHNMDVTKKASAGDVIGRHLNEHMHTFFGRSMSDSAGVLPHNYSEVLAKSKAEKEAGQGGSFWGDDKPEVAEVEVVAVVAPEEQKQGEPGEQEQELQQQQGGGESEDDLPLALLAAQKESRRKRGEERMGEAAGGD